jgi:hypothetical protein
MRSTKFYSATMVLGLVFALATTLAAQDGKNTLTGAIVMYNACDPIADFAAQGCTALLTGGPACYKSIIAVPGFTQVDIHKNGKQAGVHVLFHNTGEQYQLDLEANQQFDSLTLPYFVPFHSVFVSLNGGSNFRMNGTVKIFLDEHQQLVSNLVVFDDNYPLSLSCSK